MIARKIAYNVLIGGVSKVLSTVLALVAIGFITRYLGKEGFGDYATVLAFWSFFSAFFDLGLYSIATREISREGADEAKIIGKIFSLRIFSALAVFLVLPFVFLFAPYPIEVKWGIASISISFFFSSTYQVLNGVFQKKLAMDKVAISELAGKVIQVALVIVAVKLQLGFNWIIFSILANSIISFLLVWWWAKKYIHFKLEIDWAYWKEFLKESLPMGAVALITFFYFKMDTILLSIMKSSAEVGVYNVAYKVIENISFFPGMIMGLILPIMSKNYFSNKKRFHDISNKTFKVFMILVVPLIVGTLFLADGVIGLIGGSGFPESALVLRILIFSLAFIFFGNFFNAILIAGNLQKKLMYILVIVAVANVFLNVMLIPHFSYLASAVVSVVTEFLVAGMTFFYVAKKANYLPSFQKSGGIFFAGIMMAGFLLFFRGMNFFFLAISSSAIYFLFLWVFQTIKTSELKSLISKNSVPPAVSL